MLHAVTWTLFFGAVFLFYSVWYLVLSILLFKTFFVGFLQGRVKWLPVFVPVMLFVLPAVQAQDGLTGLTQANTLLRGYYDTATQILYAFGGLSGLIGAGMVFAHWNDKNHNVGKEAALWFGGCIFLVLVATVIKSFFGI